MRAFIYSLIGNAAGLAAAVWMFSGLYVTSGTNWAGTLLNYGIVALVLTLLNMFIRPIIRFLSLPLYVLTFGLFSLVVNAIILSLAGWLSNTLEVNGFWTAVFASLVISILASIVTGLLPRRDEATER